MITESNPGPYVAEPAAGTVPRPFPSASSLDAVRAERHMALALAAAPLRAQWHSHARRGPGRPQLIPCPVIGLDAHKHTFPRRSCGHLHHKQGLSSSDQHSVDEVFGNTRQRQFTEKPPHCRASSGHTRHHPYHHAKHQNSGSSSPKDGGRTESGKSGICYALNVYTHPTLAIAPV